MLNYYFLDISDGMHYIDDTHLQVFVGTILVNALISTTIIKRLCVSLVTLKLLLMGVVPPLLLW